MVPKENMKKHSKINAFRVAENKACRNNYIIRTKKGAVMLDNTLFCSSAKPKIFEKVRSDYLCASFRQWLGL